MNNIVVYAARNAARGTTKLSRTFEGRVEIDTLLLAGFEQEQFLNDMDNVFSSGFSPEDQKKEAQMCIKHYFDYYNKRS